ncbi:MAG: sodium/proton-translocating pyrophosphatase [Clostridia bacterium]|nr:sodium/proton-translocating pyrophosphatase [Clostridia bacterium]
MSVLAILIIAALLALSFAAFNFFSVKKLEEGSPRMQQIAAAIRVGAGAFISYEYKVLAVVILIVAVVLSVLLSWNAGVALLIGAVMSASAGFVGMKIATYANVRVSNEANNTRDIGKTLKVAFKGGSVMGLCVGGFALLGLFLVYIIFGIGMKQLGNMESVTNWLGVSFLPFANTLSGYALGCSIVAMFNRIGCWLF